MDLFSSEYGWDTEQVLKLTTREISLRIKEIGKRLDSRARFEAGVHGITLGKEKTQAELSSAQKEMMDKALKERMQNVKPRSAL